MTLAFTIPGVPVPCARARVFVDRITGKMRAARPAKTAAYERHVATCANVAASLVGWEPIEAECSVAIRVFRAARRGDWDNFAKAVTDGMLGIAYPDDRFIVAAEVEMHVDRTNPRVEVEVRVRDAAGEPADPREAIERGLDVVASRLDDADLAKVAEFAANLASGARGEDVDLSRAIGLRAWETRDQRKDASTRHAGAANGRPPDPLGLWRSICGGRLPRVPGEGGGRT